MESKSSMHRPRTLKIRNGEKAVPTFSTDEMQRRLATLRKHMSDNDISYALFTSIHNINYFADFVHCTFGRPYGLVVSSGASTTISANIDGGQPWRQSFGDNLVVTADGAENITGFPFGPEHNIIKR